MQKDFLAELLRDTVRTRVLRLFIASGDVAQTLDDVRAKTQTTNRAKIATELKELTELGILKVALEEMSVDCATEKKETSVQRWILDREHPYAQALRLFVRDTQVPIDDDVVTQLRRAGKLRLLIVAGGFSDTEQSQGRIDLLIVGESLHEDKIQLVLRDIEAQRGRELQYAIFSPKEFKYRLDVQDRLIRDVLDYPHHVLLDKLNML